MSLICPRALPIGLGALDSDALHLLRPQPHSEGVQGYHPANRTEAQTKEGSTPDRMGSGPPHPVGWWSPGKGRGVRKQPWVLEGSSDGVTRCHGPWDEVPSLGPWGEHGPQPPGPCSQPSKGGGSHRGNLALHPSPSTHLRHWPPAHPQTLKCRHVSALALLPACPQPSAAWGNEGLGTAGAQNGPPSPRQGRRALLLGQGTLNPSVQPLPGFHGSLCLLGPHSGHDPCGQGSRPCALSRPRPSLSSLLGLSPAPGLFLSTSTLWP